MTSPFAQAHASLTALGYHTLPLIAFDAPHGGRGKAPGAFRAGWQGATKWQRFRDEMLDGFDLKLALAAPNANIGIVCGSRVAQDQHVVVLDFDATDPDALDTLLRAAPASPMVKRGQKGESRFYVAPKTVKTRSYDGPDGRLMDLLTGFDTRQTVVPPSIHPDTREPYVWMRGPVAAADLPELTDDDLQALEEALEMCGWERGGRTSNRQPRPRPTEISDDIWSEAKSVAMSRLSDWVPALELYNCRPARGGYEAVESWRASSTGRALSERKRNLSIQPDGIKDWGSNNTYSAIDLVMAARDCDQAEATDWLRERLGLKDDGVVIALGLAQNEGQQGSAGNPMMDVLDADLPEPLRRKGVVQTDTPRPAEAPKLDIGQPITAQIQAVVAAEDRPAVVGNPTALPDAELPDHLTHVPGLVGDITEWVAASARKPQRGGALLAALELVGTAAGRKFSGPTLTGTHLYGLFLAPSGAAKDHPLKCIGRVLHASTMGQHFGPGGFMSLSAVISRLTRQPLTLSCIDEFGSFLGRINGRKASTHEKAITGVLRTAWGSSFDTMAMPEWAGRVGEPVHSPALSLYGVSTHEEFFQNLEGGDVFNGFLNRFLIVSTQQRVQEREPTADKTVVPASIVDGMVGIYTAGNPLARASSHNAQADGPMIIVPWADKFAHAAYLALAERVGRMEHDQSFYARTAEMAQRLATIRAIGINPSSPRVTLEDMDWGAAVACWSASRMAEDAQDYMASSEYERLEGKVTKALRRGPLAKRDLSRVVRVEGRLLDAMIKDMLEREQIVETKLPAGPSGGRPRAVYALA